MNIAEMKRRKVQEDYRTLMRSVDDYLAFVECRSVATQARRRPKVAIIQETIADHYQLHVTCMTSKDRPANFVEARHVAIAICRALTKYSQSEIGECFGGRDHGTISNAVTAISNRLATEPDFQKTYQALIKLCTERIENHNTPLFNRERAS